MSNMYSLLNYIAATSKEIYDPSIFGTPSQSSINNRGTLHSLEAGLRGLSEDEKRLIGISTISVVTRLALEFQMEEVRFVQAICRDVILMFLGHEVDDLYVVATPQSR